MEKDAKIIVRAESAGVFYGTFGDVSDDCRVVTLINARRLWYWSGAASLSELAVRGVARPDNCKFPTPVPSIVVTGVIEMIETTPEAQASIEAVPEWTVR